MLKRILIVAGLLAAVWLVSAPLLRAAGAFLVVDEPPRRADAIVVLSGSVPDRILEAVDLYQGGYAPLIVLCREPENAGFRELRARGAELPRIYELNLSVARQLGVPESAITVLERDAGSTYSEARVVLQYLAENGARSMLLVTSKYHTRRAGAIYRHLAGGAIEVVTRPARSGGFDADSWWQDRMSIRRLLIEYQKLLLFQVWDRWKIAPQLGEAADAALSGRSSSESA
jgi:uncharacterized SAM-binding protein YcdF (DUF218 family)